MCGRYVLGADASDYAEYFDVDEIATESLGRSYNVAPTDHVYTVAEWQDRRLLGTMRWGFVPHWAPDRTSIQINARSETIATKPMFRDSFARKRCIIPADGFYEWEPKDKGRTPHWVFRADGFPMAFAGVWSTWNDPDTGERLRTCAIVTTKAAGPIAAIHDRMPVSLDPSVWDAWLDRDLTDPVQAEELIQSIPVQLLMEHAVSSRVNSVRNNDPGLTSKTTPETLDLGFAD
jgi:putative SOS response-associated peptidase YedK